ncbi:PPC domain-containing protein [Treponema zioleckii]|uniref:PPC domain-containing protein n=1 Tax=Treponema zioleckii TaxID=331680 RepID=UPI00168BC325|nr:PPC domain-containing protein [Treponema zioleckii]
MKKIIATLTAMFAAFAMGTFAFAETYINANDLESQTLTSNLECEDGFVILATPEKNMEISKQSSDCPNEVNGEVFTKRIKIGGAGKVDYRSISFNVKAGQKITVYSKSTSKTDARLVALLAADGSEVGTSEAGIYGDKISVGEFTAPADGTYYVTSKKSGIYVYSIIVK